MCLPSLLDHHTSSILSFFKYCITSHYDCITVLDNLFVTYDHYLVQVLSSAASNSDFLSLKKLAEKYGVPSKDMKNLSLSTQQSAHIQSQSQSQSQSVGGFIQRKASLTQSVSADSLATGSPQSLAGRGMQGEDGDMRKRASTPLSVGATSPPQPLPLPLTRYSITGSTWLTEGQSKSDGLIGNLSAVGSVFKPGNLANIQTSHLSLSQSNNNSSSSRGSDAGVTGAAFNLLPPLHHTHMDEEYRGGPGSGPGPVSERFLFGYDVDFSGHHIETSPGKFKAVGQGQGSGMGSGVGQGMGAGQGSGMGSGAGFGPLSGTRSSIVTTTSAGNTSSSDMDDDLDSDDEADSAFQDITAKYQDSVSRYGAPTVLHSTLLHCTVLLSHALYSLCGAF